MPRPHLPREVPDMRAIPLGVKGRSLFVSVLCLGLVACGGSRGDLEKFVVTGNDLGSIENGNSALSQFVVSDSDPAADEVPAMDGLNATPEESKTTTPEDAGIGAEDAAIPEEIHEPAAHQEETVPV